MLLVRTWDVQGSALKLALLELFESREYLGRSSHAEELHPHPALPRSSQRRCSWPADHPRLQAAAPTRRSPRSLPDAEQVVLHPGSPSSCGFHLLGLVLRLVSVDHGQSRGLLSRGSGLAGALLEVLAVAHRQLERQLERQLDPTTTAMFKS